MSDSVCMIDGSVLILAPLQVVTPLLVLQLQALEQSNVEADHVASHLGKSAYIARVVAGVPHVAQQRVCLLPTDLMARYGISPENLYAGDFDNPKLADCVLELATRGRDHLIHLKDIKLPSPPAPLRMERALLERFYQRLEQRNFRVVGQTDAEDHLLPFYLLRAKWQ